MLLSTNERHALFYQTSLVSESRNLEGKNLHFISVSQSRFSLQTPLSLAVVRAKQLGRIAQHKQLPVRLFLSGGIDSEAMAYAFLSAGVYFEVVIGRYNLNMNEHDYHTAVSFCEKHNIHIHYIDVDVFQFLENGGALAYAHELGCRSPQIAVHLHLLDQIGGFPVLAGNPIYFTLNDLAESREGPQKFGYSAGQVTGLPGQTHSVYLRYFEKRQRMGEPFFFQSTPELLMSFLLLENSLASIAAGNKNYDYLMKCRMYQEGGFAVYPRDNKFTGFEKYREEYDRRMGTSCGIGFNEKFRFPLEKITPQMEERIFIPCPPEFIKCLKARAFSNADLNPLQNHTKPIKRRLFVSSALASTFLGWIVPLSAHALTCYPPAGCASPWGGPSPFITSGTICSKVLTWCSDNGY